MSSRRKVTVRHGKGRRLVEVDFEDYEGTIIKVKKKWGLEGKNVILKAVVGDKEEEYDIVDNDDLDEFKETEILIVRLESENDDGEADNTAAKPEAGKHASTDQSQAATHSQVPGPVTERRMSAVFEGSRKLVNIDVLSHQGAIDSIRKKFDIEGEFDIQGKLKGHDEYYDILAEDYNEEITDAESLLVKRRESKPHAVELPDAPKAGQLHQRRGSVVCDGSRKPVSLDMKSLANTKDAIKKKFALTDDFDILGQLPGEKELFDIQTDDDLADFKDAESFHVKLKAVYVPDKKVPQPDEPAKSKLTLKTKFEGQTKFVSIDVECIRSTRNAISKKLKIDDDFKLLVKKNGVGEYIDVDDDDDIATLTEDDVLLVERKSSAPLPVVAAESEATKPDPVSKALVEVRIGKSMYPVDEAPPSHSLLVRNETIDLRTDFDLKGLVHKTDVVADCLRLARYGVARNPELNAAVGKMMSSVAEMTQVNKNAVTKFRMKGADILNDLVSGVGFLMERVDTVAVTKFKNIKQSTSLLKEQSEKLRQDVETRRAGISGVLEKIVGEKSQQTACKQRAYNEVQDAVKKELERRVEVAKKDTAVSDARVELHEKEIATEKDRVKAALDKTTGCGHGCRYGHCYHGWCPCLPYSRSECCYRCCSGGWRCHHKNRHYYWFWSFLWHDHDHGIDEKRVKAEQALQLKAEQDREKEIAERKKLREAENKAIDELQKHIASMKLNDPEKLPEDFTESALRAAESAIQSLEMSLLTTIHFWDKMNHRCESMGNTSSITDGVGQVTDLEERERYLNSTGFQREAVNLYAKWVALRRLCEEFDTHMKPVEVSIQKSILDNPAPSEALKKIPQLISTLDAKLELQKIELAQAAKESEAIMEGGEDKN